MHIEMQKKVQDSEKFLMLYTHTYEDKLKNPHSGAYLEFIEAKSLELTIIPLIIEKLKNVSDHFSKNIPQIWIDFTNNEKFHLNILSLINAIRLIDGPARRTLEEDCKSLHQIALENNDFEKAKEKTKELREFEQLKLKEFYDYSIKNSEQAHRTYKENFAKRFAIPQVEDKDKGLPETESKEESLEPNSKKKK